MKVFDRFHVYLWNGRDNNCNSCLFAGVLPGGKHVLVDPGHFVTPAMGESALERLLAGIRRDGLDPSAIGLVILTHGHPDHVEGAVDLARLGAKVALHREDGELFRRMGGEADLYLQDGTLELDGEFRLDVLHSPGHSPGHITLYWPERKVLVAGDCVFYRSTGRTDFPGGDAGQLRRSIERMAALDVEELLCGHPYGHSGFIRGREEVRENFRIILTYL
ncbi:MAG: MBL fold metallo-hydrolase [Acidobacteriota bacterium]|jgi:glyoxylase-like metal-dependent hydrolase (beta-lactamase superfamily II)|nr:MBL fold metallo-hydrolase [Acidobacteriota bacterium]NLT32372.1 MBL fold metallo-hydrolase [Acidobacteriota bacterium]